MYANEHRIAKAHTLPTRHCPHAIAQSQHCLCHIALALLPLAYCLGAIAFRQFAGGKGWSSSFWDSYLGQATVGVVVSTGKIFFLGGHIEHCLCAIMRYNALA